MPQVSVNFANQGCIDDFIVSVLCGMFGTANNVQAVQAALNTLLALLYLYRIHGDLSTLASDVPSADMAKLQAITSVLQLAEQAQVEAESLVVSNLKSGLLGMTRTFAPWLSLPKYIEYTACPALQKLFTLINAIFSQMADDVQDVLYEYNKYLSYVTHAGQDTNIVNQNTLNSIEQTLNYISGRIGVLCDPLG